MPWSVQIHVPFDSQELYDTWTQYCQENNISSRKGVVSLIKQELKRVKVVTADLKPAEPSPDIAIELGPENIVS
jgi:hypothetical protein